MAKSADCLDVHIGSRVRLRRMLAGVSQEQLGEALGVTFQQIQKYEKGLNRIGAGRLYRISRILKSEIGYFYEGLPGEEEITPSRNGIHVRAEADDEIGQLMSFLSSQEGQSLSRAFTRIDDPATRRRLVELVRTIAEAGPN